MFYVFSMFFRDRVFDVLGDVSFLDFTRRFLIRENRCQNVRRRSSRIRPPSPIFLYTCESYLRKTRKCDFKGFLDSKTLIKVFLHNCEYCFSKAYKCAVTKLKKLIVERLWILIVPRIYLGATLAYSGICL